MPSLKIQFHSTKLQIHPYRCQLSIRMQQFLLNILNKLTFDQYFEFICNYVKVTTCKHGGWLHGFCPRLSLILILPSHLFLFTKSFLDGFVFGTLPGLFTFHIFGLWHEASHILIPSHIFPFLAQNIYAWIIFLADFDPQLSGLTSF